MKKTKEPPTYEGEVLSVLAHEFSCVDHAVSERKIKRRLREKKIGAYDQARIDAIRRFKDHLQDELGKHVGSQFHTGAHGEYSNMQDWDFDSLLSHMKKEHPDVPETAIAGFLAFAIYLYYLR